MKRLLILTMFIPLCFSAGAKVEKIDYRGWTECYKISNDSVEVIVLAQSGGRILRYSHLGVNLIYENSGLDGKGLADYINKSYDPDGGRFDYGPEAITRNIHDTIWVGPWTAVVLDEFTLKITSMVDYDLGCQEERIFQLDPASSHLVVKQTMTNVSGRQTDWFYWGRTLIPSGGKMVLPLNRYTRLPHGWGKYIWGGNKHIEFDDPQDANVMVQDSLLTFMVTSGTSSGKYGTDSDRGWMAYGYNGKLFTKRFAFFKEGVYTSDSALTQIFYTNGSTFGELEPVSPQAVLQPGESYSFTEHWWLLDYPDASTVVFDAHAAARFILANTDTMAIVEGPVNSVNHQAGLRTIVYPNPASEEVTFGFVARNKMTVSIRILDITGRETWYLGPVAATPGWKQFVWRTEATSPGIYLYVIETGDYRYSGRLLIE